MIAPTPLVGMWDSGRRTCGQIRFTKKKIRDSGGGLCSWTHVALKTYFNRITEENKEGQYLLEPDKDEDDDFDE